MAVVATWAARHDARLADGWSELTESPMMAKLKESHHEARQKGWSAQKMDFWMRMRWAQIPIWARKEAAQLVVCGVRRPVQLKGPERVLVMGADQVQNDRWAKDCHRGGWPSGGKDKRDGEKEAIKVVERDHPSRGGWTAASRGRGGNATHFHREDGLFARSLDGSERRSGTRQRGTPNIMTDLYDRMGVARNAGANQAVTGVLQAGTEGLAASLFRDILQEERMAVINTWRGHLRQDRKNPDSDWLHCRTRRNAGAIQLENGCSWQGAREGTITLLWPEQERAREEPVWSKGVGKSHP